MQPRQHPHHHPQQQQQHSQHPQHPQQHPQQQQRPAQSDSRNVIPIEPLVESSNRMLKSLQTILLKNATAAAAAAAAAADPTRHKTEGDVPLDEAALQLLVQGRSDVSDALDDIQLAITQQKGLLLQNYVNLSNLAASLPQDPPHDASNAAVERR